MVSVRSTSFFVLPTSPELALPLERFFLEVSDNEECFRTLSDISDTRYKDVLMSWDEEEMNRSSENGVKKKGTNVLAFTRQI